jgi:RNA polymerase sigma-70 factor, ECF subfamily
MIRNFVLPLRPMQFPLATAFLSSAPDARVAAEPSQSFERILEHTVSRAREVYPGIAAADDAALANYMGARISAGCTVEEGLAQLIAPDLLLALGCLLGDGKAITYFEERCIQPSEASMRKRGMSDDVIDEAKQCVRERLLVGSPEKKLVAYDGRGELRHWVRVTLVREAIAIAKKQTREEPLTFEMLEAPSSVDSPEMQHIKQRYRNEYKESFEQALTSLSSRERALLRQQYVLGLSVDQIGVVYQVHRSTAARWVEAAREELWSRTRTALGARLGIPRAEMEQVVELIQSQLHVSLERLLHATRSSRHG